MAEDDRFEAHTRDDGFGLAFASGRVAGRLRVGVVGRAEEQVRERVEFAVVGVVVAV